MFKSKKDKTVEKEKVVVTPEFLEKILEKRKKLSREVEMFRSERFYICPKSRMNRISFGKVTVYCTNLYDVDKEIVENYILPKYEKKLNMLDSFLSSVVMFETIVSSDVVDIVEEDKDNE